MSVCMSNARRNNNLEPTVGLCWLCTLMIRQPLSIPTLLLALSMVSLLQSLSKVCAVAFLRLLTLQLGLMSWVSFCQGHHRTRYRVGGSADLWDIDPRACRSSTPFITL
jgi:hypothetical protein